MKDLWREAPKSARLGILLVGKIGLVCPSCGARFRVLQARYGLATLGSYLGILLLGSVVLEELDIAKTSSRYWLFFAMLFGLLEFLRWRYSYRLLTVRVLGSGEQVSFPLVERKFSV
jgi:hypothetical protein